MNTSEETIVELSIITISRNNYGRICQLLDSIEEHLAPISHEIFVMDCSDYGNTLRLHRDYPDVYVMRAYEIYRVVSCFNFVFSMTRGKYISFISSNNFLEDDSFKLLLETLKSHPSVGGVSPMIRYTGTEKRIKHAGFTPVSKFTQTTYDLGDERIIFRPRKLPYPVPYLNFDAMVIRREAFLEIGPISEVYGHYFHLADWCADGGRLGYHFYCDPRCSLYCEKSPKRNETPALVFHRTRDKLLYAFRNVRPDYAHLHVWFQIIFIAPFVSLKYHLCLRHDLAKAVWMGIKAFRQMDDTTKRSTNHYDRQYNREYY